MDYSTLYAERIGGRTFGQGGQGYKFTKIKNARDAFIKNNPSTPVIDMGVGEPEERAPDIVIERLFEEAKRKENRIYSNNGSLPFKEAAARYLKRTLDLDFDPEQEIVHCIGSKSALALLPTAFVNPGDTIVTTVPGYPVLPTVSSWLNARVVTLKLLSENGFLPDLGELERIAQTQKPKLFLLNYPNNPTGACATADFFEQVVSLAHRYGFLIVQDAAYADFVHQGAVVSPLQVKGGREVTIEAYSLSKSFNMQGWRLGFVVSCPALLKAYAYVKDNTDSGQFLAVQKAGVEALDSCSDFVRASREKYLRRLNRISTILTETGVPVQPSPATFYLYAPVPSKFHSFTFRNGEDFSNYLISKLGVICVPWDDAGAYVRFSMTFELGTSGLETEEAVYEALQKRMR